MARELGKHDSVSEDLAAQLPVWMPKDDESGNWKLLKPIADEIEDTDTDRATIDRALTVQHADTIDQLARIAALVELPPERGESLEHYRARVLAQFQLVTSEGTVGDLLNAVSTILDTDLERITYTEQHTAYAGDCQVGVPGTKLDGLQLTDAEFAEIVDALIPGGYRVNALRKGTLTYVPETAYSGPYDSVNGGYDSTQLTSDSTKGHDGLDANGNPKGNGGTYAGVLQ